MARYERIVALARAALQGNAAQAGLVCRQIIASEKPESSLRKELDRMLEAQFPKPFQTPGSGKIAELVRQRVPSLGLEDLILDGETSYNLANFILHREHARSLRDENLSPPNRVLLMGPPGGGKTSLAGAIAKRLNLPFIVVDFAKLISSHLGETGAKLAVLFREINNTPCVLFIDEMETLLSARGNAKDVGEMGRVVSSLLLEIDQLSDEVILIGATNHAEMLDHAVHRRFQVRWVMGAPTEEGLAGWLDNFAKNHPTLPVSDCANEILERCDKTSYAHFEHDVLSWARDIVIQRATVSQGQKQVS